MGPGPNAKRNKSTKIFEQKLKIQRTLSIQHNLDQTMDHVKNLIDTSVYNKTPR